MEELRVRDGLRDDVARALRRARGDTSQAEWVRQLAPHLGHAIDGSQWSRYENGRIEPPAAILLAAARAAGVGVSVLLAEEQPTPEQLMRRLNDLLEAVNRQGEPRDNPARGTK